MKAMARLLHRLLRPDDMSLEWLEAHDRSERDLYEGACADWSTAPAAWEQFGIASRRLREQEEEPTS